MSKKILVPLLAAIALIGCGKSDDVAHPAESPAETPAESPSATPSTETAGDQTTTPGGNAGETAATPPTNQAEASPPQPRP